MNKLAAKLEVGVMWAAQGGLGAFMWRQGWGCAAGALIVRRQVGGRPGETEVRLASCCKHPGKQTEGWEFPLVSCCSTLLL